MIWNALQTPEARNATLSLPFGAFNPASALRNNCDLRHLCTYLRFPRCAPVADKTTSSLRFGMISRRFVAVIALCSLIAWLGVKALSLETEAWHGSPAYHLMVPRILKQVPLEKFCERPQYRMSGQDGTKPPISSMAWGDFRPARQVMEELEAHFESQLCNVSGGGDFMFMCPGEMGVNYGAQSKDGCSEAFVSVWDMSVF